MNLLSEIIKRHLKITKKSSCVTVSTCVSLAYVKLRGVTLCKNCDVTGQTNVIIGIPTNSSN